MSTASRWPSAVPAARPTPPRTAARTRSAVPPVVWTCPTRWQDRSTSRSNSTSPAPDRGSGPATGRRHGDIRWPGCRSESTRRKEHPHEKQQTRTHPGRSDRRTFRDLARDSLCRAERTRPARRLDAVLRPASRRHRPADSVVATRAAQLRPRSERNDAGLSASWCCPHAVDAGADRGADNATTSGVGEPARQGGHLPRRVHRRAFTDHRQPVEPPEAQPISDSFGITSSPKPFTKPTGSDVPGTGPVLIMSTPSSENRLSFLKYPSRLSNGSSKKPTVFRISVTSRPTASQWRVNTSILWVRA